MTENEIWKQRFLLFTLMRLFGVGFFLFGIAVTFTDLLRPGGWPLLGGLLVILGAIEAVVIPRVLKRTWEKK